MSDAAAVQTADLYQALSMARARAPRHAGRPAAFTADAAGDNPMCGDRTHVYLSLSRDHGRLTAVAHESRGCAIMTASADLMAGAVAGLNGAQIQRLRSAFEAVVSTATPASALRSPTDGSGVAAYRSRIRCATLPWSALAEALEKEPTDG